MLSVLRIVTGFCFLLHGCQKMFGMFAGPNGPMPFNLMSQMGAAGVLEVFGSALILIGLFTRPVAFLLAGEMAVAYFQVHFPRGPLPIQNGGDNVVLFCFIFLYLAVAGGGSLSVDHAVASRKFNA